VRAAVTVLAAVLLGVAAEAGARPVVVLSTTLGDITVELYPDEAPITVENFLGYVRSGYYDGTVFHRVIPRFIVQGGGLTSDLEEKRDGLRPRIPSESGNGLRNAVGTLAMARTSSPDSAAAQFFFNLGDNDVLDKPRALDGVGYAVFGKVTAGMDVLHRIEGVKTAVQGPYTHVPLEPVVLRSIRVLEP